MDICDKEGMERPISLSTIVNEQTQESQTGTIDSNILKSKSRYIELDEKLLQCWVERHEVHGERDLLRVPLCRLVPNETIRTTKDSVEDMGEKFKRADYRPNLANFLVSERMPNGDIIRVTEDEEKAWDETFWGDINREFDNELELSESWKHLVGQKLVVYDGNHRLLAWKGKCEGGMYL